MRKTYTSKKRVAVDAYFFNNFGDDLFLEILINRYPDAHFDFITPFEERMKNFVDNPRISRVSRKQALKNVRSYDLYVMIGGSMFQQPPNWKMQWVNLYLMVKTFKLFKKATAIIGCNFGPFEGEQYLKAYKSIFRKLDYLSVRDEKSFTILKDNDINLHCYPDMAFSFDLGPYIQDHKGQSERWIGVSLMDFGKENLEYENKMAVIINQLLKHAKLKLFSFQYSDEINDLKVIERVLEQVPNHQDAIEVVNYDGNMKQFLQKYHECQSFLTTRFHSLIISLMFNQKIVAINYNPKIENTLKFLNINLELFDLDELDKINIHTLLENDKVSYNLDGIRNESVAHFHYIDSVLK